jgi:hypothetical protein
MDAVLKVGGSLAETPIFLKNLCLKINELCRKHSLFIVPGGSKFADTVRFFDREYQLPPATSHKMALLAMDQYGMLLSTLISNSVVSYELKPIKQKCGISILLPSRHVFTEDPLPHSWKVTSDSIAAYVAIRLHTAKLILITNVDGIYDKDPKNTPHAKLIKTLNVDSLSKFTQRTSVDRYLSKVLAESKLDCYVVNGMHPERVEAILNNQETICTRIIP